MGHGSAIIFSVGISVGLSAGLFGGVANAAPTPTYSFVSDGATDRPASVRQLVPAALSSAAASGLAKTRTIYLNHLGATLSPGNNDSQAQTSSIVSQVRHVPGWNASAADWAATVSCMKAIWAPFDVVVTDVDPGATPHIEALFGGSPADVGLSGNIGGISPFTADCSVIEHSIVFAFTDNLGKRPRTMCEVMSQEVAHSYGLDHEMLASDPMTYLPYSGDRAFRDQSAACGENKDRPCGIAGTACRASQNSYQLLLSRVGAADRDHAPSSVQITSPGATTVSAGFVITATAADNAAVTSVAFYLDGDLLATATKAPYQHVTASTLSPGAHTIVVEATDAGGHTSTEQRDITVAGDDAAAGTESGGCAAGGTPPMTPGALSLFVWLWRRRRR